MRFLMHYNPDKPLAGPPNAEMMGKMAAFMQASVEAGVLIATGTVMPSALNGMRMTLANGAFNIEAGSPSLGSQGGWAVLEVDSPQHLTDVTRQFLDVAGDGEVKVLQITQVPLPASSSIERRRM